MKLTLIALLVLVAFTALVARTRRNHTAIQSVWTPPSSQR